MRHQVEAWIFTGRYRTNLEASTWACTLKTQFNATKKGT